MLEEIGFKYNVNTIDLNKGDQFKSEFKKISPFSKIPVIKDQDNNEVIFESGAILIYLAEKSGKYFDDKNIITQWYINQSLFTPSLSFIVLEDVVNSNLYFSFGLANLKQALAAKAPS